LTTAPVISIVDDDDSSRKAIANFVRSLGYVAASFASAEAFLRSDRLHDTDCLITDLQMPGLSGIGLQSALIAQGNKTPMIFVTAFGEEGARRRALEAGAVAFLNKPFDEGRLIEHLHSVLQGRDGASAPQ